ncbi:hypothetical protein D9758_014066 [Tetrapyrgos nigripes]|uniref:Fungal lipase-type domain-containing protein n=1 Tax=Tetrapyrgos nigripes TaxID=182062 RepID=A0A8H5FM97_9AGAR|nr:hypothetical protein D9758_014066 [Tetrapyrgos nigripes]
MSSSSTSVNSSRQYSEGSLDPEAILSELAPNTRRANPSASAQFWPSSSPASLYAFLIFVLPCNIQSDTLQELIHYFKYASSAYTPVCPRPNRAHLVTHFSNPVTDIQGFVARDNERKEIIIAFRGSASVADILLDSQIILVPFLTPGIIAPHGIKVHSGFLIAWDSIAASVFPIVISQLALHPDIRRIITVGHSLGGAISTLAAMSIMIRQHEEGADVLRGREIKNYSYGAPRAGNKTFAEFVNNHLGVNAYRVVHADDG